MAPLTESEILAINFLVEHGGWYPAMAWYADDRKLDERVRMSLKRAWKRLHDRGLIFKLYHAEGGPRFELPAYALAQCGETAEPDHVERCRAAAEELQRLLADQSTRARW